MNETKFESSKNNSRGTVNMKKNMETKSKREKSSLFFLFTIFYFISYVRWMLLQFVYIFCEFKSGGEEEEE